jgi:glycosyltransferase involved in cell wall biosynthesis
MGSNLAEDHIFPLARESSSLFQSRIAVINSHPIQYFAPLYAFVNATTSLTVTAIYCSDFSLRGGRDPGFDRPVTWDVDLLAGYEAVFLKGANRRTPKGFWSLVAPAAWREVRSGKYSAVWLHGYMYAAFLIAFVAAKSRGLPVFMRSETHKYLTRPTWKRKVRDSVLRYVYRYVDGFLAIGTWNREYYRSLGVPDYKIFSVPYTVDNARFIAASKEARQSRESFRRAHGIPAGIPVVLYASKLIPRKRARDLILASKKLSEENLEFSVLIVGTGESAAELTSLTEACGLFNVAFAGFMNQSELPVAFAASDIFVLPSEDEPWGLIVNEAMCAGLPIVVADKIGCATDLVRQGENGFTYPAGHIEALSDSLRLLISDAEMREKMGMASLARIESWSYQQCAVGLLEAVQRLRIETSDKE